jgi:hypothetical protein
MFLGWYLAAGPAAGEAEPISAEVTAGDYYVRQLRDWKLSVGTAQMAPETLRSYGALCGRTLARAHARSGDRIAIGAYLGKSAAFEAAIGEFAIAYADQNERDYDRLKQAVASGRLTAEAGV